MQKLYGEMETAINEKKQQRDFSSKNCSMKEDVSEVIKKSRMLKKYLSRAISFGLQVESLIVSKVKSGVKHNLTVPNKTISA